MEARIQLALTALRENRYRSLRQTALAMEVPVSTLAHRAQGRESNEQSLKARTKLLESEEEVLVKWVLRLEKSGFPPRVHMLVEMTNHLLSSRTQGISGIPPEIVGRNWAHRFTRRHAELKTVLSRTLNSERWLAMDRKVFQTWFELFNKTMEEHRILQANTYNMDEKGVLLGRSATSKVIVSAEARAKFIQQPGTRESITIVECVGGHGQIISPLIIWAAKTHRNSWYPLNTPSNFRFATSPNGYTDNELAYEWLTRCFHPESQRISRGKTRLLIMDGHGSHLTGRFLGFCMEHDILPLCLPSHSTHMLQPLDVGLFSPVSHYYRKGVEESARQGIHGISKHEFLEIYTKARAQGLSAANIKSAWKTSGLFPFDPEVVLNQLHQPPSTPPPHAHGNPDLGLVETPHQNLRTPKTINDVQHTMSRLEQIEAQGDWDTSTRTRIQKLSRATEIAMAEQSILQEEVNELAMANRAKRARKTLDQSILSRGRVLDMNDVNRIREQEEQREGRRQAKTQRAREREGSTSNLQGQEPDQRQDAVESAAAATAASVSAVPWEQWTCTFQSWCS